MWSRRPFAGLCHWSKRLRGVSYSQELAGERIRGWFPENFLPLVRFAVCVCSGHDASSIKSVSLQVHGTVRSTSSADKVDHLKSLPYASGKMFAWSFFFTYPFKSRFNTYSACISKKKVRKVARKPLNHVSTWQISLNFFMHHTVIDTHACTCTYVQTERLKLFEADLLDEDSFQPAFQGCVGVFHAASPVLHAQDDPENKV